MANRRSYSKRTNRCECGGTCFKVEVSAMEAHLNHEKFRCEKCGREYKITPKIAANLLQTVQDGW